VLKECEHWGSLRELVEEEMDSEESNRTTVHFLYDERTLRPDASASLPSLSMFFLAFDDRQGGLLA